MIRRCSVSSPWLIRLIIFFGSVDLFLASSIIAAQNSSAHGSSQVLDQTDNAQSRDWTTGIGWNLDNRLYQPAAKHEGEVQSFLSDPIFETSQVFTQDRFPNIVVAMDGTVLAVWNGVQVRRSADGGETWGAPIHVGQGLMGGGVTVDEISGDILIFVEDQHPPAPLHIYRSTDQGLTWKKQDHLIHPNSLGHVAAMHMNEHGITLRHGSYKGRLIRPSRWYGRNNYPAEHFHTHYTNAIFSDDGGRS